MKRWLVEMELKKMNITSIMLLIGEHYKIAKQRKDILKPWAWAVYQTWKAVETIEQRRIRKDADNESGDHSQTK